MKTASSILLTLLIGLLAAGATRAQPTACSDGVTTNMAEETIGVPETSLTVSCPGFTFASAETAVLFDASGLPSDIVTLTNVAGVATISFVSDNADIPLTLPVGSFISVNEPDPFVVVALSTVAGVPHSVLHFISDAETGTNPCGANSDCLTASAVPEPATLSLFGIGLLGSAWIRRRRREQEAAA
jgi:AraC-like DNA-binding protein